MHLITQQVQYMYPLPFPRAFHPSLRYYNTSEERISGSNYSNLIYIKYRKIVIITDQRFMSAEVLLLQTLHLFLEVIQTDLLERHPGIHILPEYLGFLVW
jgi:hypothetical protein